MVNLTNLLFMADTGNFIGNWLYDLGATIGNFGWTVVVFTVILKLVTSPFDIWQKVVMRRNQKAMERMKPQLDKLQKQYANNPDILAQKQMALYKKEKFSTFGSCLPMILTMVIFFVVFAGFNATVSYQNKTNFMTLAEEYDTAVTYVETATNPDTNEKIFPEGIESQAAQDYINEKVLSKYENEIQKNQKFLWIENIFVADTWANPIPDFGTFIGQGMGKLGINIPELEITRYNAVMGPVMAKYNTQRGGWNGLLLLPIFSFLLNFVTSKLMSATNQMPQTGSEEMQKSSQMSMKIMQWMMPIMMLVFALLYSSAFTLYMFVSALLSTLFQLITNFAFKLYDKKQNEKHMTTSYK